MQPLLIADDGRQRDPGALELRWIGNATVLLRLGGITVLTDPNFLHAGDHAKLGGGLRSRRLRDPACELSDLPPLDLVVLSHHHGDHFDEVAARELDPNVPIITTPHAARKLRRQGFTRPLALHRWQAQRVVGGATQLRVIALPGRHGPGLLGHVLPPVMGSLLEVADAEGRTIRHRLYLTGDTIWHADLAEIGRRHPTIDTAVVHLGATRPLGLPALLTMDAEQGVRLLRSVEPRRAVPVHFDDYTVMAERDGDVRLERGAADLPVDVVRVARGATLRLDTDEGETAADA